MGGIPKGVCDGIMEPSLREAHDCPGNVPADDTAYALHCEAESILHQIGIPVSVVINSLYRQIIFQAGVLFSLTLPKAPRALDGMSAEGLDAMLSHSFAHPVAGEGMPYETAFDELGRRLA